MGGNNSKPSIISYEDALKRINDVELRRIKEAFKRSTGVNGSFLSKNAFIQEVLCEGTPINIADWLFHACGGSNKGINFKELLSALVLITRGSQEEKIKFLWALYSNDSNQLIIKTDFYKVLQIEANYQSNNTSDQQRLNDYQRLNTLSLFGSSLPSVSFDQFRSWILMHKDATILSKWLLVDSCVSLSSDLEAPTFYQSLAGVTHLEENEICDLEKVFWQLKNFSLSGQLDIETLTPLLSPPLPRVALKGFFAAFDENCDGHIDFKELCCGVSCSCRGPDVERTKFCFKIFDQDRDGTLNAHEVEQMIRIMLTVAREYCTTNAYRNTTYEQVMSDLKDFLIQNKTWCNSRDAATKLDEDFSLSQEDFLMWCVHQSQTTKVRNISQPFLDLLYEVCHIVFGLRPQCKHMEFYIVKGWLMREMRRGYEIGQFWYLISSEWWQNWLVYTQSNNLTSPCAHCKSSTRSIEICGAGGEFAMSSDEGCFSINHADSIGSNYNESAGGDSSSLGSGSSGISINRSSLGCIDNSSLLSINPYKAVTTLTGEGGRLKKEIPLVQHRDFELVPEALWKALSSWYGGSLALPRQVVKPPNTEEKEIELYPLNLKILRHQQNQSNTIATATPVHSSTWNSISSGYGALSNAGGYAAVTSANNSLIAPKKYLAYIAAFSRLATIRQVGEFLCIRLKLKQDTIRLWHMGQNGEIPYLLEDEATTLEELNFHDNDQILLEIRNKDLTWPEELRALSQNQNLLHDRRGTTTSVQSFHHAPGACGLHNLGNSCYMNSALQVLFNTKPLTEYFRQNIHLFELNTQNKMGTKGHLTIRYAELLKEVLSAQARSIAPIKFRFCVSKFGPQFADKGQHDSQELLDWLLDQLHEDLNRVTEKPYIEIKDSNGRSDQLVANEAFEAFLKRNNSIIVDLFYGQMKSKVTCETCKNESVRFEPFSLLSLPLPVENYVLCEVLVTKLDGTCPIKYGLRLNSESKYWDLKNHLAPLCNLDPNSILICHIESAQIKCVFSNGQKINPISSLALYVYELPKPFESPEKPRASSVEMSSIEKGLKDIQRSQAALLKSTDNHQTSSTSSNEENATSTLNGAKRASLTNQPQKNPIEMMGTSPMSTFMATGNGAFEMSPISTLESYNHHHNDNSIEKSIPKPQSGANMMNGTVNNNQAEYDDDNISISSSRDNRYCANYEGQCEYLIAVHRKFTRQDTYFLSHHKTKPSLFGVPLLIPLHDGVQNKDIYCSVWMQVSRLLSPLPPSSREQSNHAEDCDDSMGYDFPFTLSVTKENGHSCALCPWEKFCRGCNIPCDEKPLLNGVSGYSQLLNSSMTNLSSSSFDNHVNYKQIITQNSVYLAIDWDASALHLRYQSTQEKLFSEHESVAICRKLSTEPVDLDHCLRAFTSEEKLDEKFHCSQCKSKQPATKKLQLWKLPPILIIHLKRFNFVNTKWVKSQKVVNFPFDDFDPTFFLASVPQENILRYKELKELKLKNLKNRDCSDEITEFDLENDIPVVEQERKFDVIQEENGEVLNVAGTSEKISSVKPARRKRLVSTSLTKTPVIDSELVDYNGHKLAAFADPFDLKYKLYAVVSHSGMLNGGHYISYATNANNKSWFCFNDSSCREISTTQPNIDPSSAYLLFYERKNLEYLPYLPKIENKQPMLNGHAEMLEESDNDLKKMCVLS